MFGPLDDHALFPLLTDGARATLKRLREHPHAPIYNWRTGERLNEAALARVRAYGQQLKTAERGWRPGEPPPWVIDFAQFCRREVPYHRRRPDWSDNFSQLPPMTREVIRTRPWDLVPDPLPIDDDLIVYTTSGTTGRRLRIISCPEAPARYLPAIEYALARVGVRIEGGEGRVAIVQACAQRKTNVMSSVSSYLGGAGFAKINLLPHDWRDPADAAAFLDDCAAEVYTGDPFAFVRLMEFPLRTRPTALVSSATALLPGARAALAAHFGCPVIDLYSMNESGPVAFDVGDGTGHEILPHDLFVEILDGRGAACPPGVRGEVALTGGNNPYMPLLRYRTGDFAAMDFSRPVPRVIGLSGRTPTIFRAADGRRVNSIDVTAALGDLPLTWFRLHQRADGKLEFRASGSDAELARAAEALRDLFGAGVRVERAAGEAEEGKALQYTSDLQG